MTKTDGTTINATIWNELVNNINTIGAKVDALSNIPTGAVMAFNGISCPIGWTLADGSWDEKDTSWANTTLDLRGQFIRGLDASRTIRSFQGNATKLLMNGSVDPTNPWPSPEGDSPLGIIVHKPSVEMIGINTWFWGTYTARYSLRGAMDTNWWWASETRPSNIALLYCVKL